MKNPRSALSLIVVATLAWLSSTPALALTLPRFFSDNMVLQRDLPVKIWGWADPGQEVEVSFAGQKVISKAGSDGRWTVSLAPLPANAEPAEISISSGDKKISIKNVLVGEVWICSGQSNMEWVLASSQNAKEALAAANHPGIRHFKVKLTTSPKPQKDVAGEWLVCTPAGAINFTAVGYHFALQLHQKLNVPIGLINTSWGGTRIEPWTDPEGFTVSPKLKDISDLIAGADEVHRTAQAAKLDQIETWLKESRAALEKKSDLPAFPARMPEHPLNQADKPTAIYNAMVAPLVPYAFRGAIWYQGESNNGEGMLYYEKMRALISSWRNLWKQGDFPFLYVQLAPYRYGRPEALPGIWEAQTAALSIPNTGMAVITDIGNVSDIHPRNKEEVGRRLSLWALAKTYRQEGIEYSGPLYKSKKLDGSRVILSFEHADALKSLDGKPLSWFTLAGADKSFVEAKAEISGDKVIVTSDAVTAPAEVRFGWNELAEPNLANGAGLPASPFRTDNW